MLLPRIIPFLLLKNGGLVKTINFRDPKYVGDPLNAVKIFNEKHVDEIVILDIEASKNNKNPDFNLIKKLARECRMPLCYGGGIKNIQEIEKIINLGVEKVALSSILSKDKTLINEAVKRFGSQSIVAVLDFKKSSFFNKYNIFIKNGTIKCNLEPIKFIKEIVNMGIGEIVINSIDCDGARAGYDMRLINLIKSQIPGIPITFVGGAGSLKDIGLLFKNFKYVGAGAGSIFVFKGKYRAVLINYPSSKEKKEIF